MGLVTISRTYGSGGGQIAAKLAEALGYPLIDHQIVIEVARRLGMATAVAEERDEQVESFASRVMRAIAAAAPAGWSFEAGPDAPPAALPPDDEGYWEIVKAVIREQASGNRAVIIGRGASTVLAKDAEAIHVFVTAPVEMRVIRTMERDGLPEAEARERVATTDKRRLEVSKRIFKVNWGDPTLYDVTINTGRVDYDVAVELILQEVKRKRWG